MTKSTHVVVHPKQYLSVGGKLQHMPKGSEVALSAKQGERLVKRGRVLAIGQKDVIDLTEPAPVKDDDAEELKALKARAAELGLEGSRWGAKRLKEEIATAEAKAAGIDA